MPPMTELSVNTQSTVLDDFTNPSNYYGKKKEAITSLSMALRI